MSSEVRKFAHHLKKFKSLEYLNKLGKTKLLIKETYLECNKLFSEDSIKLLYSIGERKFLLMADEKNNVYLAYIDKILTNIPESILLL